MRDRFEWVQESVGYEEIEPGSVENFSKKLDWNGGMGFCRSKVKKIGERISVVFRILRNWEKIGFC